jgi:hypothetical protein
MQNNSCAGDTLTKIEKFTSFFLNRNRFFGTLTQKGLAVQPVRPFCLPSEGNSRGQFQGSLQRGGKKRRGGKKTASSEQKPLKPITAATGVLPAAAYSTATTSPYPIV